MRRGAPFGHMYAIGCWLALGGGLAGPLAAPAMAEPVRAEPARKGAPVAVSAGEAQIRRSLKLAFPSAGAETLARLVPDETMALCARYRDKPPKEVADAIRAREAARIRYPDNDVMLGDWRRGEAIAQSGYGLRFTDGDTTRPNGGNCYACHQLSPDEVSFGTIGVSLKGYGRTKSADNPDDVRAVYEKIFNAQALVACSQMPRFGVTDILTMAQIKDLVALLLDPESPVNRAPKTKPATPVLPPGPPPGTGTVPGKRSP